MGSLCLTDASCCVLGRVWVSFLLLRLPVEVCCETLDSNVSPCLSCYASGAAAVVMLWWCYSLERTDAVAVL